MAAVTSADAPNPRASGSLHLSRLSDEFLARQAARGSERAFAALYERYHQPLYRYCRSILRHDSDAQDALQSTFTGALVALQRNQRSAPLRPWLYRIAHNESISLLRRRSRDVQPLENHASTVASSAEEEASDRARWRTLVEDLGRLPDRQRGALLLRELSGLSHEDIGVALGLTPSGAKQAIFEAREGLARIEEGRAMRCEEVRQRISEGDRRVLRGRQIRAHLRECSACEAFAVAIPQRRAELKALTPILPPAAAAALLTRSVHAASPHGGASAVVTAGAVGKAAGTAVAWKALSGVAIVATAAAGATGLVQVLRHHSAAPRSVPASHHRAVAASERHSVGVAGRLGRASVHRAAGAGHRAHAQSGGAAVVSLTGSSVSDHRANSRSARGGANPGAARRSVTGSAAGRTAVRGSSRARHSTTGGRRAVSGSRRSGTGGRRSGSTGHNSGTVAGASEGTGSGAHAPTGGALTTLSPSIATPVGGSKAQGG